VSIDSAERPALRGVEVFPHGGPMHDVPLGTLVFRAGLMPQGEIESALREAVGSGQRLGTVLVDRGLDERALARLLAAQNAHPFVDLDDAAVDETVAAALPPSVGRMYCAFPFALDGDVVVVAVPDAGDDGQRARLSAALGRGVRLVSAARNQIKRWIDAAPVAARGARRYEVVATLTTGASVVVDRMTLRVAAEELAERVTREATAGWSIAARSGRIDGASVASVEIFQSGGDR
jgi:hypothetical protein